MNNPSSDSVALLRFLNDDNPIMVRHAQYVSAGFPSPAADHVEEEINFNTYLMPRPNASFVMRVKGDSMKDANIPDDALIVVDRSIKPLNNRIVVAVVNGEFTVKRFIKNSSGIRLMPANERYKPIPVTEGMDFSVWGTVTQVIVNAFKV